MAGQGEPVGWAILGTAFIAHKIWRGIRESQTSVIVAVASRSKEKAQAFIDECQTEAPFATPPLAIEGYEEAIKRSDVQVVYIPLPTALRKEWVLKAAANGKHVLVEKPVGCTVAHVKEMVNACLRHNVHFLDGVMFNHSLRFPKIREAVSSQVGKIRRITTQFTFRADDAFFENNIRCAAATEPLGCLGDLGWYCIRFTLCVKDLALPHKVRGIMLAQSSEGVPFELSGEMVYTDGTSASFFCSFLAHEIQQAVVVGEKATIEVPDFVLPTGARYQEFNVIHQVYKQEGLNQVVECLCDKVHTAEPPYGHVNAQECQMIRHMAELAKKGPLGTLWPEHSLKTQTVLDAVLASAREDGKWVELPTI